MIITMFENVMKYKIEKRLNRYFSEIIVYDIIFQVRDFKTLPRDLSILKYNVACILLLRVQYNYKTQCKV